MNFWRKITQKREELDGSLGSGGGAAVAAALSPAEQLAAKGQFLEAVRVGTEQNRLRPDGLLEEKLVLWRNQAFSELDRSQGPENWPPAYADPFPDCEGIPEITVADLSVEAIAGSVLHHGSLIVRGFFNETEAQDFIPAFERGFEAWHKSRSGATVAETLPWYSPMPECPDSEREFMYPDGLLAADSPRNFFNLLEVYGRNNVGGLVERYLGEPPVLSVKKTTLRKVPANTGGGWHQDGAFLGGNTHSINLWVALSHCGVDAPGLDIVPFRIPDIVETGTHGSYFHWAVGDGMVDALCKERGTTPINPVFAPGDAVFFDQLTLHRTAARPGLTKDRFAIESWFFSPSTFPMDRIPVVV